jgi:glycosyltransferase involved in cell wall biosynthesis
MKIAVNTQLLIKDKLEGIGWFEYETLKRITRLHPEHQFYFIFDRPWDEEFVFSSNVHPLRTTIPSRHPVLWYNHYNFAVPSLLSKHNIDLFVSPDGFNVPKKHKTIIVLHDLNFVHFPKNLPYLSRKYYESFFPGYAQNASRIVTVSNYSKQDIAKSFDIDPGKIDVVYNGSSREFVPLSSPQKEEIKKKYTEGLDYFIFVGALNPRKNIYKLLSAFDDFCARSNRDVRLVVAGVPMFSSIFFNSKADHLHHKEKIHFVGRLDREELARLVGASLSLVLPSTFEGFGIPIVEAMYCDVPVITSNITAMPEVAGDAALLVDPYSIESITNAMLQMAGNEKLRNTLIKRGKTRRKVFSWDQTAEKLWNSIEKCL